MGITIVVAAIVLFMLVKTMSDSKKRKQSTVNGTDIQTTEDIWARLATMEAVLHHKMQSFFWTGVYVLIDGDLIVRSYQGPVACQNSEMGEYVGLLSTPEIRLSWIM